MTASGPTRTLSMRTLPLAVVRWPKLDQLSMIVEAGRGAWRDRQMDVAVFIDGADVNEMREQSAGRIEFLAVDHEGLAVTPERRFKGADVLALGLRKGVAEAIALKHAAEPKTLLLFAGRHSDRVQSRQMILRQLAEIGVCGGNDRDHLSQRREGNARSAIGLRHGDRPQA